jgi:hypothetical protein
MSQPTVNGMKLLELKVLPLIVTLSILVNIELCSLMTLY